VSATNDFNQSIIDEFRANKGVVGGGFAGAPMVILHTTGAKSGSAHVNPLVTLPGEDGTLYIFASAAGAPKHPDWYHNLVANPEVQVEYGDATFSATAVTVTGSERDEIFAKQASIMPGFTEYEEKTAGIRTIPVVKLTR